MLKNITCTPLQAAQLIDLGIEVECLFYVDEHLNYYESEKFPETSEEASAVFTMEELNVMIGGDFPKPDLWPKTRISKATDPISYPVFLPEKAHVFKNGAEASAFGLIYLLENGFLKPEDCNERYLKRFKQ